MPSGRKLASLRSALHLMERDLGLDDLSGTQRDVYYAANLLSDECGEFTTSQLHEHALTKDISRPTFFRILKSLLQKRLIVQAGSKRSGLYIIGEDPNTTLKTPQTSMGAYNE